MIEQFIFLLRSVAQTQTFAGVLHDTQVHMSALLTAVLFSGRPKIDFAQFNFMRSLLVLWALQGTRFTCDDFS
jgi:hypothetical protein